VFVAFIKHAGSHFVVLCEENHTTERTTLRVPFN